MRELLVDPYFYGNRPVDETDADETQLFQTFRQPILDLVQKPDVDVYRYWDDRRQPAHATHPDLPTIVYARKGQEAIVAITSYADW